MATSFRIQKRNNKKVATNCSIFIHNIHEHPVSKSFKNGNYQTFLSEFVNYVEMGGSLHLRDTETGESFLHALCKCVEPQYVTNMVKLFYLLGTKIDVDLKDYNSGETVLHRTCLIQGAWPCIVALMRCGASPQTRNNAGFTAEGLILRYKYPGWEENLYWLRKFSPGLWTAVTDKNPDIALIERLLKSWCRTVKVIDTIAVSLKTQLHYSEQHLDLVCVLEKYENTNEVALALLSGRTYFIDNLTESEILNNVNVNTKDHSYQYSYRDYPTAPRPLLAAVWEVGDVELMEIFLKFKPDPSVKYTFEAEAECSPKPLFFQLVNPKVRPENEGITAIVLKAADLDIRNVKGQTVLFDAIYVGETENIIKTILDCGVNIAARDVNGRTARDLCVLCRRNDYRELIDSWVSQLIINMELEKLHNLIIQQYDIVIPDTVKVSYFALPQTEEHRQLLQLLRNIQSTQALIKKLFSLAKIGNFAQFSKLMSPKFANARDKAGRSLLHYAVQNSSLLPNDNRNFNAEEDLEEEMNSLYTDKRQLIIKDTNDVLQKEKKPCRFREMFSCKQCKHDYISIIKLLVETFPHIVGFTNNLGQTALHYGHIYSARKDVLHILENGGEYAHVEDVFGLKPDDYNQSLCGEQTFQVRRKPITDMDINIFLAESQFETHLKQAVETGRMCKIRCLIDQLVELGGQDRYGYILFDSLDAKRINLTTYLIQKGFNPSVSKQYETCNPENPMCAMMECTHTVTTLRQRAEALGVVDLINLISEYS